MERSFGLIRPKSTLHHDGVFVENLHNDRRVGVFIHLEPRTAEIFVLEVRLKRLFFIFVVAVFQTSSAQADYDDCITEKQNACLRALPDCKTTFCQLRYKKCVRDSEEICEQIDRARKANRPIGGSSGSTNRVLE